MSARAISAGELSLVPSPNVADVTQKRRSEIISTRAPVKLGLIGTGAMWPSSHKSKRKSGMPLEQAPATAFPRPLGALEKLFWLADQNRPTHFAIAAEVGGSMRIEQWQDALDRVCRQSERLSGRRIVPDERGAPVFTPVPYGSIPLHVVENAMSEWTADVASQSISRSMPQERRCCAPRCCMVPSARSSYSACTTPSRMASRSLF
jgi:hypothetical protein